MTKADECRRLAEQCLRAARATSKKDVRAALLQRAQVWLELAQWLEGEEGTWALPPAASEHAQPSIQQQQQVQPDKGQEAVGPLYTLPVRAPGSSMTDDTVELATRHFIEARKIVAGQRRIARDLEATGLDAHAARTALDVFEDTLAVFEEHLQRLRELRRR